MLCLFDCPRVPDVRLDATSISFQSAELHHCLTLTLTKPQKSVPYPCRTHPYPSEILWCRHAEHYLSITEAFSLGVVRITPAFTVVVLPIEDHSNAVSLHIHTEGRPSSSSPIMGKFIRSRICRLHCSDISNHQDNHNAIQAHSQDPFSP